ncbi:unnamed protein product [Microthlaspi erraticum]|uniref:EamA domain-containing protein n=1 Tax=Microthlaspi erraticum TaxID=1685480 RepID=A0A6D2J2P3_9BRAS|nr:unnamed protein product [Microthlaspi erraticum]CAA7037272.1 unnamed protein product [Microthlaspi erraticum]CAA7038985.1 unnamed protein product [Microthlaspi erraticum]
MNSNLLPVVAAVILQIMSIIAKYALDSGLSPRIFVAERLAIASLILTPLALIFERNTRPPMTVKVFAQILTMSMFEPLLEQNLYYSGMQYTTPTFTSGMFNLLPAITFAMACVFRFEKVAIHCHRGRAKLLGTCVAVGGAMIMTFWRGHAIPLPWTSEDSEKIHTYEKFAKDYVKGGLMLVSSCLSWSFYMMIQANVVASYQAKLSLTALICIMGTIGSTFTACIWERNTPKAWKIRPDVALLASLYGGCFSAATVYLLSWMVKKKGPVFVSIFNPLNLIATAVISSVVLSEQLFVGRIIGSFVIILGISSVLWGKMGEQSPLPQPPPPQPEETTQVCKKKLTGWYAKNLSQGGKEVLLKSCAMEMPVFAMSCFKLPVELCKNLTSAMMDFWWSSEIFRKKIHWVGWEKLTLPKSLGGIGFKELMSLLGILQMEIFYKLQMVLDRHMAGEWSLCKAYNGET